MTQSLWDLAIRQNKLKEEKNLSNESVLVFSGSKGCGKSTILNSFLEKDEKPKPTLALEYSFGRRILGPHMGKSVVHLWELGGGSKLSNLLDVTVSKENIEKLTFVVVADLSSPSELWVNLMHFLSAYETRLLLVLDRIGLKSAENFRQHLITRAKCRIDENHPDKHLMNIFPSQLIIIGSKFDKFFRLKSEDQNFVTKALRFLAHYHAGGLVFTSSTDVSLNKILRNYLSYVAFKTPKPNIPPVFKDAPLFILPGQDNFASIGLPPMEADIKRNRDKTPLKFWEDAFCKRFPQVSLLQSGEFGTTKCDPAVSDQFVEAEVDAVRQVKDEELERYRRKSERIMREQLQQAAADGLFVV